MGPGMLPQMMMGLRHQAYPPPLGKSGKPVDKRYYDLLQVPVLASDADIRQAYRNLSRRHHPDKGGQAKTYQDLMQAHAVLSDAEKRACYDAYGAEFEKVPQIQEFVADLRPPPLDVELPLSTRDCLKGKQTAVKYSRMRGRPGVIEAASVSVSVPANVAHGQRLTFHGQGHTDSTKPLPGDLIVVVVEKPSPESACKRVGGPEGLVLFKRSLTLAEALCGSPIALTLPDGSAVTLKDAVVRPARWYLVDGTSPAMYVSFDIEFPETLTETQRETLRTVFGLPSATQSGVEPPAEELLHHTTTTTLSDVTEDTLQRKVAEAQQRAHEDAVADAPPSAAMGSGMGVPECHTQ